MSIDRRSLLQAAAAATLAACGPKRPTPTEPGIVSIALLHLAPEAGAIGRNRAALLHAIQRAAEAGAQWLLTPELCVSGYAFADLAGTDWIAPQPDAWLQSLQTVIARLGVTVFVGMPERSPTTGHLHNAMVAIGPDGQILGRHWKVRTLSVGSEAWSSPGSTVTPIAAPLLGPVGMFVCADAVDLSIATSLQAQGARILVSSANWAPGQYGPAGEWEACSASTGLPLIVCNRTGVGRTLDFRGAESVVICEGTRRLVLTSEEPTVFLIQWDALRREPISHMQLDS